MQCLFENKTHLFIANLASQEPHDYTPLEDQLHRIITNINFLFAEPPLLPDDNLTNRLLPSSATGTNASKWSHAAPSPRARPSAGLLTSTSM
jgi:hypothetical protein